MKFTLVSVAAFLMVGVWASEAPKSNETAATSTTSGGDKPAAKTTPKPKKKKGCLAGCFAACAGSETHKGVGDLAGETVNLALDIIDGQQDGKIEREEAHDIANDAAGITTVIGDMIQTFNEVRNEDLPDGAVPVLDEPVIEKKHHSKKSTKLASSSANAGTDAPVKKARSHKKSRTAVPVSDEKK